MSTYADGIIKVLRKMHLLFCRGKQHATVGITNRSKYILNMFKVLHKMQVLFVVHKYRATSLLFLSIIQLRFEVQKFTRPMELPPKRR